MLGKVVSNSEGYCLSTLGASEGLSAARRGWSTAKPRASQRALLPARAHMAQIRTQAGDFGGTRVGDHADFIRCVTQSLANDLGNLEQVSSEWLQLWVDWEMYLLHANPSKFRYLTMSLALFGGQINPVLLLELLKVVSRV